MWIAGGEGRRERGYQVYLRLQNLFRGKKIMETHRSGALPQGLVPSAYGPRLWRTFSRVFTIRTLLSSLDLGEGERVRALDSDRIQQSY